MDIVAEAKPIVAKHMKAMGLELALSVVMVAVKEAIDKSPNPYDNMAWMALEPKLKEELQKALGA